MLDGLEVVNGLHKFPIDRDIRKAIWSEDVFKHPAKYNIHMVWKLVNYCTTEGQTILDPMSGTGTSMVAAINGRNVILIEIEEKYHEMQQAAVDKMEEMGGTPGSVLLLHGDCRKFLPMPGVDFIMFSPPYADMIKRKKVSGIAAEEDSSFSALPEYSKDPWNIGKQNYFMYCQIMERVYKDLLATAPLMAVVVKDRYKEGIRVRFVDDNIKVCAKVGWTVQEHIKFRPQGTEFINIQRSMGFKAVEDESIVIFRR